MKAGSNHAQELGVRRERLLALDDEPFFVGLDNNRRNLIVRSMNIERHRLVRCGLDWGAQDEVIDEMPRLVSEILDRIDVQTRRLLRSGRGGDLGLDGWPD